MKMIKANGGLLGHGCVALLLFSLTSGANAQSQQQNQQQMQHMMQMAQQAQACMAKIDRGQLDAMANRAKQMEVDIKQLCEAGKRSEAQSLGIKYGLEMSQSAVAKEMRKCSEMMSGAFAGMGSSLMPGVGFPEAEDNSNGHICDAY